MKSSAFKDAPPTKAPSTSSREKISLALSGLTDPPYNIFGLPRIMSNENDIKYLTSIFKHENNGITLCTGSLGVDKKNNIERIIKKYGKYINFIHLRNIKRDANSKNIREGYI